MINWRKVGMTSSWPLRPGYTRAQWRKEKRPREQADLIKRRSPDWSLQLDSMKSESLVIVDQNATVNTFPGLVHRPSHHGSGLQKK